ncbi:hypothetical protein BerOc1_00548 [Pseudodesulfovibrio hydrargyri]|uniref:Bacterial extracellular solute-binding protein, family 3 n=1 Tax=Pseudodesulfovibrio hydrargyri TaxID=2125990 RepID=A0A1J5N1S0_9BACT|nr:hypothetical protein [Pseudodesulfovibrio hydrargyri]OIQ52076.1 hypothetical protein BerOc1_00548 [Pseudodesulfovibrio hydrargyri]
MSSIAAVLKGLRRLLPALVLASICLSALPGFAGSVDPVTVTANKDIINAYREILALFGGDPLKVTPDIPAGRYDRTAVELVIVARALRLGGMNRPVAFVNTSNARRAVEEVLCGNAVMTGQQLDTSVLNARQNVKDLYLSDPVTPVGEFHKLFYCLPENKKVLAAHSVEELNRAGRGIIGSVWNNDRKVLTDMGVTGLTQAPTFPCLIKMILAGRADWIPMEASNHPGMERFMGGHRFVPVPGIRFSLIESRHFMVSRHHPDGEAVFNALQAGLKELRRQGFIRAMLAATGFRATDRLGWKTLNQDAVDRRRKRPSHTP